MFTLPENNNKKRNCESRQQSEEGLVANAGDRAVIICPPIKG